MARKQGTLPGMAKKTIKEVDDAAEAYQEVKEKRMELTRDEKTAKDALVFVMRKHNLEVYKDTTVSPALVVHLLPGKDGVKVSKADEEIEEEPAEKSTKKKGSTDATAA